MTTTTPTTAALRRTLALRAALPGLVAGAIGAALALAGALGVDAGPWIAAGVLLAALTGACGAVLKAIAVVRPAADPQAGPALQIAMLGDFVLQIFVVGGVAVAMHLAGLKYESVSGFALAFATVALAHEAGSAFVLARALRRAAPRTLPESSSSASSHA